MVAENRNRTEFDPTDGGRPQVFLIGLPRIPDHVMGRARVRTVGFSSLTSAMLYLLRPDLVVCPLVHADFDAAQLVTRLQRIGYGGRLIVIADVPDTAMVAAELAELGHGITIRVVGP